MEKKNNDSKELEAIGNILVLQCIKMNATSDEIGRAVGVDSSVIRRQFPMREELKEREIKLPLGVAEIRSNPPLRRSDSARGQSDREVFGLQSGL